LYVFLLKRSYLVGHFEHRAGTSVRCWWFTPVILATWEAEIWRIIVSGQFRQKVHKPPL
jgi:hypothetical protein